MAEEGGGREGGQNHRVVIDADAAILQHLHRVVWVVDAKGEQPHRVALLDAPLRVVDRGEGGVGEVGAGCAHLTAGQAPPAAGCLRPLHCGRGRGGGGGGEGGSHGGGGAHSGADAHGDVRSGGGAGSHHGDGRGVADGCDRVDDVGLVVGDPVAGVSLGEDVRRRHRGVWEVLGGLVLANRQGGAALLLGEEVAEPVRAGVGRVAVVDDDDVQLLVGASEALVASLAVGNHRGDGHRERRIVDVHAVDGAVGGGPRARLVLRQLLRRLERDADAELLQAERKARLDKLVHLRVELGGVRLPAQPRLEAESSLRLATAAVGQHLERLRRAVQRALQRELDEGGRGRGADRCRGGGRHIAHLCARR
mmetsp:Transcript_26514/g.85006  ORF Transcript_26514/g.85006 Transcript_26514/m.85006 type:complete len:365 (-) Transcript_26514:787-1881(-)